MKVDCSRTQSTIPHLNEGVRYCVTYHRYLNQLSLGSLSPEHTGYPNVYFVTHVRDSAECIKPLVCSQGSVVGGQRMRNIM